MKDGRYVVLAMDDDMELMDSLELFIKSEDIVLYKVSDVNAAIDAFRQRNPDLLLLDVIMENDSKDGFYLLRKIRKESKVPVIMVTARSNDYDKILGLELGADDYITKPYNPLEVVARIKALLRRSYSYKEIDMPVKEELQAFNLTFNCAEGTVFKSGREVMLTRTEYRILELLMKNQGRIFTKQQIFSHVWEDTYYGEDSTIMMHISNLRNKIEDNPKRPVMIKTVKGLGYKFEKDK